MTSANSNPFDFSDFAGRAPAAAAGLHTQSRSRSALGGFDPFGEQSSVALDTRTGDEVFTAPATGRPAELQVAGPPLLIAGTAFAVAGMGTLLAIAAAIADSPVLPAFVGWLLAGPAAIGLLARFSSLDTRRRVSSVYSAPTWVPFVYWVVVITCVTGIALGAWRIALWAGTQ